MTVVPIGNGYYIGLSSDTKPTNVPDNSEFYETDTKSTYRRVSGTWTLLEDYTYESYRRKGITSDKFYVASLTSNNTDLGPGSAMTANFLYAAPMIIPKKSTIDKVGIIVATGVASANVRIGCYADDGTVQPGALVADFGVVSGATSSTAPSLTASPLPITLNPGLYWFAAVSNLNPQLKTVSAAQAYPIWGFGLVAATVRGIIGVNHEFTYAALPNPYPNTNIGGNFSNNYAVFMRFV